ncbi:MAG: hypothetical protein JOY78_10945, partial [Pseudonocardia sp.]|nr:hypothetical protein [Pseudonocardia sp.]
GAVAKFCRWLSDPRRRLAPFGDEGYGDGGFSLHSHAVRHTVAAMFDEWGVDKAHRKAHLGHRSDSAAQGYGKHWRRLQVEALQAFDQRMRAASEVSA